MRLDASAYKFVWTCRWIGPYESAFNVLQKFAWANPEAGDLLSKLRIDENLHCSGATARKCLPAFLSSHLAGGLLETYAKRWAQRLESEHFRFCPKCLARGFHSILHQLEALQCCPIHGDPLRSNCSHCNAVTPVMAKSSGAFKSPFSCLECTRPFAGVVNVNLWPFSADEREEIARTLRPLADWLTALGNCWAPAPTLTCPLPQLSIRGPFAHENEQIVAFSIACKLVPWPHSSFIAIKSMRPLQLARIGARRTVLALHGEEWKARRRSIVKAIRRKIFRMLLRRHRQCLRTAFENIVLESTPYGPVVLQTDSTCPLAATYVRWFRALEEQGSFRQSLRCAQYGTLSAPAPSWDATLASWAWTALAEFYSCAATTIAVEHSVRCGQRATLQRIRMELAESFRIDWGSACWIIPPESRDQNFNIILGTGRIVDHLCSVASTSCSRSLSAQKEQRVHWSANSLKVASCGASWSSGISPAELDHSNPMAESMR